ncbi:uncharacterized protein LOC123559523 [Mercenaria mercenaria]|uniref:uncharacterized protein LOC123559523 n=1 Tax=Mercenaria mercenaria TaxID=6596 RepID=UPI00234FB448|nr:uncharacterized protein LOC123559523 [Mercenaria mercenaria]
MEISDDGENIDEGEMLADKSRSEESQSSQRDIQLNTSTTAEKAEDTASETDSNSKTDKLEKYLEDIYKKYCKLSIDEAEIEFIRNGVERLTLEYIQKTYPHMRCKETSCKVKHFSEIELVKVGSFYEGTRNGYPDEFDFIGVLGTVDEEPDENTNLHLRTGICTHCEIYQSGEFPDASIRFNFTYGSRTHGKAERLEYLYRKGSEEITIDVDVVTALRCYNTEKYYTGKGIFNKEIYHEILNTGSFLFIYTGLSVSSDKGTPSDVSEIRADDVSSKGPWDKTVTETEKRLVRDVLSKTHRKVYRLLKYIINGPFGEELFKHLNDVPHFRFRFSDVLGTGFCISSYAIKVAIIHHHYKCDNNSDELGDCVFKILMYILLAYEQRECIISMHSLLYLNECGSFIGRGSYAFLGNFYWCLNAFINRLKSLETAGGLNKCTHELEDSFMEMALRLDIFRNYEKYLSHMNDKYSDQRALLPERSEFGRLAKKVKHYKEKRNAIPECPWCDYPIFVMAHKRNL